MAAYMCLRYRVVMPVRDHSIALPFFKACLLTIALWHAHGVTHAGFILLQLVTARI